MPTSATHITVVERVAASNAAMMAVLGDPFAAPGTAAEIQMRFAKLGAVGPDIFYAMADYGGDLQDLENFLIKVAGTFQCVAELMGQVSRFVDGLESQITLGVSDSIQQTFNLISAAMNEGVLALVVGPAGMNFWPVFEAARQKDLPRERWYWADYLHYIKSGKYAQALIDNARTTGNANLLAYAYGYLTHYVTDVVGHPYVNQVVQGPWRDYWQRHHLVENFMDAYVWDRWHHSNPPPPPPSTSEPPLDTLLTAPNTTVGSGAPVTFARLNDHIDIGSMSIDPVDGLVEDVCQKIEMGLFDVGIAENIDPAAPTSADFNAWCELVRKTIAQVYDRTENHRTPENLAHNIVPGTSPRKDGHPTADDVAGAYGVFRLVLRIGTEEKILEPLAPNIASDITAAVNKLASDLQSNLSNFPPPPVINTSGSFSWASLWNAVKSIAQWLGETLAAAGKTVFDFVSDSIALAGTAVSDSIKYAFYLLNKALFAAYSAFRDVLVLAAYAIPYTNRLSMDIGGGHSANTLWRSVGNTTTSYPVEEIDEERAKFFSSYAPFVPPAEQAASQNPLGGVFLERPNLAITAPYVPAPGAMLTPDAFLDDPIGDDMFSAAGPQIQVVVSGHSSITIAPRNFGGAVANSIEGITLAEKGFPGNALLPDYNLDGDRSYAWPCWDISDQEPKWGPTTTAPSTITPLRPEATVNDPLTTEAFAEVAPVVA